VPAGLEYFEDALCAIDQELSLSFLGVSGNSMALPDVRAHGYVHYYIYIMKSGK
jgi:hypothetical protein